MPWKLIRRRPLESLVRSSVALARRPLLMALMALSPALQAQSAGDPTLDVTATREDFDVLRRALAEAHGGFGRFSSRIELERRLDVHRAELVAPMSKRAFIGRIAETVAELRDGHARLAFDSATAGSLAEARLFPVRVLLEEDRLMVLLNESPSDPTLRPGMQLLRINDRPVDELIATILPKISGDGFVETGRRTRLAREFAQLLWLYADSREAFSIAALDLTGQPVSTTVPGVRVQDRRPADNPVNATAVANIARLDGARANIVTDFHGDSSIARIRIRSFSANDFAASLDTAFRTIRERNAKALVLDLRGNGGGTDEHGALLLSYLLDRPFRYFEYIHMTTIAPSFATWPARTFESLRAGTVPDPAGGFRVTAARHPGVGEQQPASQPFLGKVVVLIDGGSFSTTADVAAHLRSRRRAIFVGEETSGTYEGNTSGHNADIVLPNSRLRLRIMMYGYWNAVTSPAVAGRGTIPDHEVSRRVADILRGVDVALERALALAR